MFIEKYDFYSPVNMTINDLDGPLFENLQVMNKLDDITKRHCINVSNLTLRICQYMHCNEDFSKHCMIAGYLHDVGKLYIPDEILFKDGILTKSEYEIMKTHTTLGYNYCEENEFLKEFSEGPLYHHEALNGTGYPNGVKKDNIPFSAQIIRVADEYDALVTKRHYKTHVNISDTLKKIAENIDPTKEAIALDYLKENQTEGKVNAKAFKALLKAVSDDILFEISSIMNYNEFLEESIKRFEAIQKYDYQRKTSTTDEERNYYLCGMKMLLKEEEDTNNYLPKMQSFIDELEERKKVINKLYSEIDIIKQFKI